MPSLLPTAGAEAASATGACLRVPGLHHLPRWHVPGVPSGRPLVTTTGANLEVKDASLPLVSRHTKALP